MKKIIITLSLILVVLLVGCDKLQPKPPIKIETQTCKIQDNTNHSHWCEYPCGNDMIEEAIKCQNISQTNSSFITAEKYNGTEFYCFHSEYYNKRVCLPHTEEVKINVLEAEDIYIFQECSINDTLCINDEIVIYDWKCDMNWNCSDGYSWTEDYIVDSVNKDLAPQKTVLYYWGWYENPMLLEINDTRTYRECRALFSDCIIISNKTIKRYDYYTWV